MKKDIIKKLVDLNREFYEKTATYFDQSRDYFWPGWEKLFPFFKNKKQSVEILDVGCGNGRFGQFLVQNLDSEINYVGMDFSAYLLAQAEEKLKNAQFIKADIFEFDYSSLEKKFDFIVLFGVLHHIAGQKSRVELLEQLKNLLSPEGKIIFSTWKFLDLDNIEEKLIDWETVDIDPSQVEPNDYLVSWRRGVSAVRYAHYFDDSEVEQLCSLAGLKIISSFRSKQKGDQYNKYYVTSV